MSNEVPMIELRGIRKTYEMGPVQIEVLKGIDLKVSEGDMLSVVGASGCGKSTLMNLLGFLDVASTGQYLFAGRHTAGLSDVELSVIRNKEIGFIFQQFFLLPRLSALENVMLPLLYRGESEHVSRRRAKDMLDRVELADKTKNYPRELSGGQQQRVAIARALNGNPSVLLADEPTGALDTRVGQGVMDVFCALNREEKKTIIIITHDLDIAGQCSRQLMMRDGYVVEGGYAHTA